MKKTLTVNIGGSVFHVEEDAYVRIDAYLKKLKQHFSKEPESEEILKDIEIRMSEIFREEMKNNGEVVTFPMAEKAITMLGQPEEFDEGSTKSEQPHQAKHQTHAGDRRFYRDPEKKVIAGVCAGIGTYMNLDPVIVRIIFVIVLFPSGFAIAFVYLLLWILFPEAYTASQRLEMQGEPVNINNIGKEIKDSTSDKTYQKKKNNPPPIESSSSGKTFLKILAYFVGGLFLIILFSIVFAITVAFIGGDMVSSLFGLDIFHTTPMNISTGFGLILFIGAPILLVVFIVTKILFRHKGKLIPVIILCFFIWIIGMILTGSGVAKSIRNKEVIPSIFNSLNFDDFSIDTIGTSSFKFNIHNKAISINQSGGEISILHQSNFNSIDTIMVSLENKQEVASTLQNRPIEISVQSDDNLRYGLIFWTKERKVKFDKRAYNNLIFDINKSKKELSIDLSALEELNRNSQADVKIWIPQNMVLKISKKDAIYFDHLQKQITQTDGEVLMLKAVSDSITIVRK